MPIESFNDRVPVNGPPARLGSRSATPALESPGGSARGTPSGVRKTDGTENLGTEARTLQTGDSRPQSSSGRGPKPPQHFNDASV